jgi:hypothetical protein
MASINLTSNQFNPHGFWSIPLDNKPKINLDLFDQNGYDLTGLEKVYAESNLQETQQHRSHRTAIKKSWFTQDIKDEGCLLNHSLLFERKGYTDLAREQLELWAKDSPIIYKLLALRPKWGLDFSMDYVDRQGNTFEVLHWEYDGFDYDEVQEQKLTNEVILLNIDWEDSAKSLLQHKDQWHHLGFFEQSEWKTNYFGIVKERFKMVAWS